MSSIGPQMPEQPSKRKRIPQDGEATSPPSKLPRSESPAKNQDEIDIEDSDDEYGPSAPSAPRTAVAPILPPGNQHEIALGSDSDSDTGPAPPSRPTVGPAPPPAETTKPSPDAESESEDSDDDYGPAPPSAANAPKRSIGPQLPAAEPKQERDSWMLAPPSSSSYTERDPTRMRNRKFASKPASSGSSTVSAIWTETPEEKLKRLQDSVLGREDKSKEAAAGPTRDKEEEERQQKIAANIEAQRGNSLYHEHQSKREKSGAKVEEEDDPSKRGFDREKDMALGGKIGTAQRRELMNKAANFGGRFQKGSFL